MYRIWVGRFEIFRLGFLSGVLCASCGLEYSALDIEKQGQDEDPSVLWVQEVRIHPDTPLVSLSERGFFEQGPRWHATQAPLTVADLFYPTKGMPPRDNKVQALALEGSRQRSRYYWIRSNETGRSAYAKLDQANIVKSAQEGSSLDVRPLRTVFHQALYGVDRTGRATLNQLEGDTHAELQSGESVWLANTLGSQAVVYDGLRFGVISRYSVQESWSPKIGDRVMDGSEPVDFYPPLLVNKIRNAGYGDIVATYRPEWIQEYRDWVVLLRHLEEVGAISDDTLLEEPKPTLPSWCDTTQDEFFFSYKSDSQAQDGKAPTLGETEQQKARRELLFGNDTIKGVVQELEVRFSWNEDRTESTIEVLGVTTDGLMNGQTAGKNLTCEVLTFLVQCPIAAGVTKPMHRIADFQNSELEAKTKSNYPEYKLDAYGNLRFETPIRPFRCEDGLSGITPYRLHWID